MDKKEPFRLSVNQGQYDFDVQPQDAAQLDVVRNADGTFHILHENRAYTATLLEVNYPSREFVFDLNGARFTVHVADQYERLVQQLGLSVGAAAKQHQIKAPMPGLVLDILVAPGQSVAKGDPLLILEAMKMENIIKAASDAVVKSVAVTKGAAVDKGQLLLQFES